MTMTKTPIRQEVVIDCPMCDCKGGMTVTLAFDLTVETAPCADDELKFEVTLTTQWYRAGCWDCGHSIHSTEVPDEQR